ncbi:MAG: hypothetical protein LBD12_00745 [Clostridiales Family XIII bacterium]|nr:hypothetical protein [Clostridiales Family XIII bacterium]
MVRLCEGQSKKTLTRWSLRYAAERLLPIYEKEFPGDTRLRESMEAAFRWFVGEIKLPAAKRVILEAHAAAREAEGHDAAQAAARAIAQAASTIHAATHCIGIVYYGTAAVAYDEVGGESLFYADIYERECARMAEMLRSMRVEDEENPAELNWNS